MPRTRLNHAVVVDGAVALVNEKGGDALSLAELAARFRVRTPSLYNHVESLNSLRTDMRVRALKLLTHDLRLAVTGVAGKQALEGVANGYRAFAQGNPGLYPYLVRTTEGDEAEVQQASAELMQLMLAVLRGYTLPDEELIHAARVLRSALHGFVSLELAQGFGLPVEVDRSFSRMVDQLDAGLRHWQSQE